MTIKDFRDLLIHGREIEFQYNGYEYFIGNYIEGRSIFKDNKHECKDYLDVDEFLEKASINGVLLKDIINSKDLTIKTIF